MRAGASKPATLSLRLTYPSDVESDAHPLHLMWADLINHSDPDTAARLSHDADNYNVSDGIKILFGRTHPVGFTFTARQLLRDKALWIPAYDVFITLDQQPVSFSDHLRSLAPFAGKRILKRIQKDPEASYKEFASKWADMGDPTYVHPHQPPPGHIICLTWDSAIPKFGIDRGSGVWNDYGNPDHFRFWFGFGDLTQGIIKTWKSQRLDDGLPVVTTVFEKGGIRYEVEQFAYPLDGPPSERNGNITVVLFQKVRLTNLTNVPRAVPVSMTHSRVLPIQTGASVESIPVDGGFLFRDNAKKGALFTLQGIEGVPEWHETTDYRSEDKRVARSIRFDVTIAETLAPRQSREFVVKLPSPIVPEASAAKLVRLDYAQARAGTVRFWSDWLTKGARFQVPEEAVNELFRASLWHALRLPRRHGAKDAVIDLPYSNFAYDQTGIPWPGVQSIYVDYMLYELRGYYPVALEELLQEFRRNQDVNGHISGFADWLMYTPSMLYASGQYYLLSHDREGFERLLPYALKALAWCEDQYRRAEQRERFPGLLIGPLNDGTGSGVWALNQAYFYAGLDRFGAALAELHDPHASEAMASADRLRKAIQTGFEQAASLAPVVQLRDHTWQPYVPSDAENPHRLMDVWYPTDVDVGPLHLVRLKALPADGDLANFLLNDHEDNLFLKGWGMANEPVYRPQGMAYLYRDDPKAAIRTFYSQMACAFSHTVFEPVEHRWMHGQYFGPPSTDGSWFELYRNLLLREFDDHTLILGQATPRNWLADGKRIEVDHAPTYFGNVSFHIASHAGSGTISAHVDLPSHPPALLIRLRHPEAKPIRSVTVNGKSWQNFDRGKEWIRIPSSAETHYDISAKY
ncbi:MAG TPA: hypothetical protein VN633_06020 [Bryobacteraceae bacterium]|nr:hypothetical protein [Bryobacteraceae bacterium]